MTSSKGRWFRVACVAMLLAAGCSSNKADNGRVEAGVDGGVSDVADAVITPRLDAETDATDATPPDTADAVVGAIDSAPADTTTDATPLAGLVISGGPDLGAVEIGFRGTAVIFRVTNTSDAGSGPLTVSTSSKEFVVVEDKCMGKNLAPSEACTVAVAFSPITAGAKSALLIVKGALTAQLVLTGRSDVGEACLFVSPSYWDFGGVGVNAASEPKTFTVSNECLIPMDAPTVSITGAAAASFVSTSTCNAPLAANGSCSVIVTFRPVITAALSASLAVKSGDYAAGAALSGTGRPTVDINIPFGSANDCSQVLAPAAGTQLNYLDVKCNNVADGLGFAPVVVADPTATPSSYTFTLSASSGVGRSEFGPLFTRVSGDAAADFNVAKNTCADRVLKGQPCSVEVRFAPTAVGVRSAQLSFGVDDARGATQFFGFGRPLLQLFPLGNATHAITLPTAAAPVNGLNFGDQAVGMPGEIFIFRAQVWGSSASTRLNPLSFALMGDDSADFRIVDNGCTAAATKTVPYTCDVAVQFYPQTSRATKSATLVATGTSGSAQLNLKGNATGPLAWKPIDPYHAQFGDVIVGAPTPAMLTLSLSNGGAVALGPVTLTNEFAEMSVSKDGCSGKTLAAAPSAEATCVVELSFAPTSAGFKRGKLTASAGAEAIVYELSGNAIVVLPMEITPNSAVAAVPFADTAVGNKSEWKLFTLKNPNAIATRPIQYSITGDFELATGSGVGTCGLTSTTRVDPGDTCTINVRFAPTALGRRTGTLTVWTEGQTPQTVSLTSMGL